MVCFEPWLSKAMYVAFALDIPSQLFQYRLIAYNNFVKNAQCWC